MIITQTVPICPSCAAMMCKRYQCNEIFYFCIDCLKVYRVIGTGKAEIELIVSDEKEESNER